MENLLYFGDNLKMLREYVPDASVDLIYLNPACAGRPPFNSSPSAFARGGERESNRPTYNALFKKDVAQGPLSGPAAFQGFPAAQITAFEDIRQPTDSGAGVRGKPVGGMAMDILWFLRRRLRFISDLYDTATAASRDTMLKIEEGEPPYVDTRDPECDDVSVPAFLEEYQEASESAEVIGHWCLIMAHASLKAFLEEYIAEMAGRYPKAFGDLHAKLDSTKASNWLERYRTVFLLELRIDWNEAPVKLTDIEQINLTRDDLIHNVNVTSTYIYQTKKHGQRYPQSLFADEMWAGLASGGRIKVGREELTRALEIVEDFCRWLEEIRSNYLAHVRTTEEPTGDGGA